LFTFNAYKYLVWEILVCSSTPFIQ
jgi:hypothetical protein